MNTCYTYFSITGEFEPDEVTRLTGLKPFRSWRSSDIRKDGKPFGFASWCCGRNDEYHFDINVMIKKTIEPLIGKIDELKAFRERTGAAFSIVAVPTIDAEESTPAFGLDLDVIDFCHAIRAIVDVDLYLE